LDVQIVENRRKETFCCEKKLERIICSWEENTYSFTDKICLINLVLSSLHPTIEKVTKHKRGIFRGRRKKKWTSSTRDLSNDNYSSRNHGGLRVQKFMIINATLLAKWGWNLFHQKEVMWVEILVTKYERCREIWWKTWSI